MLLGAHLRMVLPVAAVCSLLLCAAAAKPAGAQSQDSQSVADAARRSREQRKNANKTSKVITDDDLPAKGPGGVNVGSLPKSDAEPPNPAAVSAAEAADKAAADKETSGKAGEDPEITRLKEEIARAEKDLDLRQRESALDKDAYYGKPDYKNDTAGKAKLDDEQNQINDKQQEVDKLKTRLAALEELKGHKKPASAETPASSDKPGTPPAPQQ